MTNQFTPRRDRPRPTSAAEALHKPAPKTLKKLTIDITRDLHYQLQGQAWREDRTMTDIVTSLITDYLRNQTASSEKSH